MQLRTRGGPYVTLFLIMTATMPGCTLLTETAYKGIMLSATWCIPGVKAPENIEVLLPTGPEGMNNSQALPTR
jgi:hypothetical protein